jgi:hypothetical protein
MFFRKGYWYRVKSNLPEYIDIKAVINDSTLDGQWHKCADIPYFMSVSIHNVYEWAMFDDEYQGQGRNINVYDECPFNPEAVLTSSGIILNVEEA